MTFDTGHKGYVCEPVNFYKVRDEHFDVLNIVGKNIFKALRSDINGHYGLAEFLFYVSFHALGYAADLKRVWNKNDTVENGIIYH